jgi:hypothetical protein
MFRQWPQLCARQLAISLVVAGLLVGSYTVPSEAAPKSRISIVLSLVDTSLPSGYFPNDTLRIAAQVLVNGKPARTGDLVLDSTDPKERLLCGIGFPTAIKYCIIDFPNAGHWKIIAKYALDFVFPLRYVAVSSIAATIHSPSPPTTISYVPQATTTTISPSSFNQVIVGSVYPIEEATVIVNGQAFPVTPGAGSVVFTDAAGVVICAALVSAVPQVECTGSVRSSAPPNPVTATYTGTSFGVNDGIGSEYASSWDSAYI